MFKRAEYQIIKARLEEHRRFIQVVTGARQIGKSTVLKQVLADLKIPFQFYTADNIPATNSAWISDCWATTRSLKRSNGWESAILVTDKIQKIANWSEAIKKKGLSEPLADRFEEIRMSHWGLRGKFLCNGLNTVVLIQKKDRPKWSVFFWWSQQGMIL